MQEFSARCTGTPNTHLRPTVPDRLVKPEDEGRQDMAVFRVKIIPGTVEVRWHDASIISAVLPVVVVAKLDSGDLGYGVGLIRALECAC